MSMSSAKLVTERSFLLWPLPVIPRLWEITIGSVGKAKSPHPHSPTLISTRPILLIHFAVFVYVDPLT